MKEPFEIFNQIESELPVDKVRFRNFPVWQFLRFHYQLLYMKRYTSGDNLGTDVKYKKGFYKKIITVIAVLKNAFWGFKNFYGKNSKCIIFSNQYNNKLIDGKISDKFGHHIIKYFGDELLVFQDPADLKHIPLGNYYYSRYVSSWILYVKAVPFIFKNITCLDKRKIEGENILNEIESVLGVKLNYKSKIILFNAVSHILTKVFRKQNTKIIFVECYQGIIHQAAILAAKNCNIPSVELQHGLITKNYEGYVIPQKIGNDSFPDYFFVFGDYMKNILETRYIKPENILPVGFFYIEYIRNNAKQNAQLRNYFNELKKKYKRIVTVASQYTVENALIDFIKEASAIDAEIGYIFIPRKFHEGYYKLDLPSNVMLNPEIDFYQAVSYSDFHSTVYSTCALEAPFMGAYNLMININGLSKLYYGEVMNDKDIINYCDSPEDFIDIINKISLLPREEIERKGEVFYKSGCEDNSLLFIKKILSDGRI